MKLLFILLTILSPLACIAEVSDFEICTTNSSLTGNKMDCRKSTNLNEVKTYLKVKGHERRKRQGRLYFKHLKNKNV